MSFFNLKGLLTPFTALKRVALKPHTLNFPKLDVTASDRYRGMHHNDLEKCIGCGNCSTICMNEAIDMITIEGYNAKDGDSGLRPRVDNGRCCWCALCVEVCPTGSLNLTKDFIYVDGDPDTFLWTPGISNPNGKEKISFFSDTSTSLSEYKRIPMRELEGHERIKSFAEVVLGYNEEEARKEARRCISCGLCTEVCPEHMHIPEYINAIANEKDEDALRIIYDNNPLPEMCGKVCTRRCEEVCAIQVRGEAIAIRWLKRYVTETARTADIIKEIVNPEINEPNGKTVGIIGAGPAGLTAAYYLALRGFDVTVYEAKAKGGGMTMYGIPKYRLPEDSLDKQISYMQSIGVKIIFNTRVGKEISFDEIYNKYDAIFMGIGFEKPWTLGMIGEDLNGSMQAVTYLEKINSGEAVDVGNKVVVIGGGNVAIDAARVARRHGAEVTILYRRRVVDMPADWEEIEGAEDEGVIITPQGIPLEIIGDDKGNAIKIKYALSEMVADENGGRPKPVQIEGSEAEIDVTCVIGAIGQEADFSFLSDEIKEKLELKRGRVVTNETMQSSVAKIFAGGDSVNSTADAISAIADGFKAVKGIEKYLLK
ncbi:MAG: FAD-dependent oxidoreductase [Bacteroidales bacterium]|nr:FAD-dependent oxidoreductase [Bacteroidales bacterium]MBN2757244.1 FAD-dependent oxidoreductase [Bacteroidales bacterium]